MFASSLSLPDLWTPFLDHPVWNRSFAWIREHAEDAKPGKYELGGSGWFAGVDGYSTKAAEDCQWENHTQTVDLQYLIAGLEGIRVMPAGLLGEPILYREASDTQKFAGSDRASHLVVLHPGDFVIFMPGEAHCPKIAIAEPLALRKLVIKIPAKLFSDF